MSLEVLWKCGARVQMTPFDVTLYHTSHYRLSGNVETPSWDHD